MKKLFRISLMMLAALSATLTTSCHKEEDDPNAITEENILGEWGFTDNRQNPKITIKADHTCTIGNQPYDWTLKKNQFRATQANTQNTCEFTIQELQGHTMRIAGTRLYFGTESDYSGSLYRTNTVIPTSLSESELLGSWTHYPPNDTWEDFVFTLNADHTGTFRSSNDATWSLSGLTLTMDYNSGRGYMHATIKSITTSATKVEMAVEGSRGTHQSWGDDDNPFTGNIVKTL